MISINDGGFQITFSNGWTVSVQLERTYEEGEAIAEIAAFKGDGPDKPWHYFEEGDFVKRWCTPDEVLDFMNLIKEK